MKTCHFNLKVGSLLAALATITLVGSVNAEDEGVVRLGGASAPAAASVSDEGRVVIRGQSDYRRRNAKTSKALIRLMTGGSAEACETAPYESYNSCDGCASYPVVPVAPIPTYPSAECAVPVVEPYDACVPAYGDFESCAPLSGSCDGCAPFISSEGYDSACSSCGGEGCEQCGCNSCGTASVSGGLLNRMTDGPHGYVGTGCSVCDTHAVVNRNCVASFLGGQATMHRARKRHANAGLNSYLRCKLGYFIPTGSGGAGSKLFGHYTRVYADDPGYFDGRDGQIYAAPGVGGPVSVPLAPNVRHAYNYGWGVPSSRLTPVSNSAY